MTNLPTYQAEVRERFRKLQRNLDLATHDEQLDFLDLILAETAEKYRKEGANEAVDYIDREFNDSRFSEYDSSEDDESPTIEEQAEFAMFWSRLLQEARTLPVTEDDV